MSRRAPCLTAAAAALLSLAALGCSSATEPTAEPDAGAPAPRTVYKPQTELPWAPCAPTQPPAGSTVVTAFDHADQYFTSGTDNKRVIDTAVAFPESGTNWSRVDMVVSLSCPTKGKCDQWDRNAALYVVGAPGATDEQAVELDRFITPYGVGMCLTTDVTGFSSLLVGTKTLRSAIDTWVGPNSTRDDNGWRITVKFIFQSDVEPQGANLVIPVLAGADVDLGDPTTAQESLRQVTVPANARRVQLRVMVTGHGQGNLDNCGEFCQLSRTVEVNGKAFEQTVWREDCADNPLSNQNGNWSSGPRAGWCPGAYVVPEVFDITSAVHIGTSNDILYVAKVFGSTDDYVNTCRPDAGDANNHCDGCVFDDANGNCIYTNTMHTKPIDRVSIALLVYE